MINITKTDTTKVDAEFYRVDDLLLVKFCRTDIDLGTSTWEMAFDDVDLEHFICVLEEHRG